MQNIQKLGRISSKIWKKKFLDSDKKFWKIYSRCCKGVNIKHSCDIKEVMKIYSERGFKEVFIVQYKIFKNWEEEGLK